MARDWSEVPFGERACYCGVQLTEHFLEEIDGAHAALRVRLSELREVSLVHGQSAERPLLQWLFGLSALALGGVGSISLLRPVAAGQRFSYMMLAGATCVLGLGAWTLLQLVRKRWFLLTKTHELFSSDASEPGLSLFLAALRKRSPVDVAVPAGFFESSRFYGSESTTAANLIRVERAIPEDPNTNVTSVAFHVRPQYEFLSSSLADWLEHYVRGGAVLRDRDLIAYGSFLLLAESADGHLTVLAPSEDPTRWRLDLTFPILGTARQKYVSESFSPELPMLPPDMRSLVSVAVNAVEGPVFMTRTSAQEEVDEHSGWFIWSVSAETPKREEQETVHISIATLLCVRPELADFLALPIGCNVGFIGETPHVSYNDDELNPLPGTYLHAKLHGLDLPPEWQGTA